MIFDELSLAPLGAGDLIDRAVRLYRRHFMTLIGIAAPPVLVSALGSTLTTIGFREVSATPSAARVALYVLMICSGFLIVLCGSVFSIIVMGGATRNLVSHLLWNEPVSARATYVAVKSRFWGLLGASLLVAIWLVFAAMLAIMAFDLVFAIIFIGSYALAQVLPGWFSVLLGGIGTVAAIVVGLILFFLLAGRVAYVPQAMLVEGRGVAGAIGRSFALASGNVRRLMAMTLFTSFATYSALMVLVIPLGWYGYLNGVDLSPFSRFNWPAWYAIGYEVIWQCSHIVLAPIWMLGLSLLYVDERVRHEGYDIELMAARRLPEMPELAGVVSPFAPALVTGKAPKMPIIPPPAPMEPMYTGTVLGLR
jgi:hypothetical protein